MPTTPTSTREIDVQIQETGGSRGQAFAHLRRLIKQADPAIVEEGKWRKPTSPAGVPAYSHNGLIGTLETYKDKVKFTFAKGAALDDPGLFNASLAGETRRAIDIFEGDEIDDDAFMALIRQAVERNGGG